MGRKKKDEGWQGKGLEKGADSQRVCFFREERRELCRDKHLSLVS